jgi:hypothetical protein
MLPSTFRMASPLYDKFGGFANPVCDDGISQNISPMLPPVA